MRKPTFCICENKDADQLRGDDREADQRLCFRYTDSAIPLLSISDFKPLAIFCSYTAWFELDQVGIPEDRFSHNEAHMVSEDLSYLACVDADTSLHLAQTILLALSRCGSFFMLTFPTMLNANLHVHICSLSVVGLHTL